VEVGEQHLLRAQPLELVGLRLLDLDHEVRRPHVRDLHHLRPSPGKRLVVQATALARAAFHQDLVARLPQLPDALRHHADPELLVLPLARHSDAHHDPPAVDP
jgi:hypothetical protein